MFLISSVVRSWLAFQLGTPALGEEVVQPVRQVEDGEDEGKDEPGDDVDPLRPGGELGEESARAAAEDEGAHVLHHVAAALQVQAGHHVVAWQLHARRHGSGDAHTATRTQHPRGRGLERVHVHLAGARLLLLLLGGRRQPRGEVRRQHVGEGGGPGRGGGPEPEGGQFVAHRGGRLVRVAAAVWIASRATGGGGALLLKKMAFVLDRNKKRSSGTNIVFLLRFAYSTITTRIGCINVKQGYSCLLYDVLPGQNRVSPRP